MRLTETETNKGWSKIFKALPIQQELEDNGIFSISARQIKKYSEREPRLMAKFDSRDSRPQVFKALEITILPVRNGEYVLLKGDGYLTIPQPTKIDSYNASGLRKLESIPWKDGIRSESQAIDSLYLASALKTFAHDDKLQLTIRGRLRNRSFSFKFRTSKREEDLSVEGVQIEVDAGYEGEKIVLLEAKSGTVDDFLIRQLYYPYRDLLAAKGTKQIVPILLVYSNRVFSLYDVRFDDSERYLSAQIVTARSLSLDEHETAPKLANFLTEKYDSLTGEIPFPQADDLAKVILAVEMLTGGPATKFEIAQRFEPILDERQGDYYGNAAVWLGYAERSIPGFKITTKGSKFARKTRIQRLAELAETICRKPVFGEVARELLSGSDVDPKEIAKLISKAVRDKYADDTLQRRAITVKSWISWLAKELPS